VKKEEEEAKAKAKQCVIPSVDAIDLSLR